MAHPARVLPPERALSWWMRLHIGLHNQPYAYILLGGWTPACAEACLLEAYMVRSVQLTRSASL